MRPNNIKSTALERIENLKKRIVGTNGQTSDIKGVENKVPVTLEEKIKSLKGKRLNILRRIAEQKKNLSAKFLKQLSENPKGNADAVSYSAASYMATLRNVVKPLKDQAEDYQRAIDLLR